MRVIKYKIDLRMNPQDQYAVPVETFLPYPEDNAAILEKVKAQAINGEYTIEEIGEPEEKPSIQDDTDAMLIDHEYRLTLVELGVTE